MASRYRAVKFLSFFVPIIRFFVKVIFPIVLVLYVLLNLFLYLSQVQKAIPYSLFAVVSDSMVPTFKKGDLIFTSKQSDYAVGDIIVFTSPLEKNKFISHRVVNKVNNSYQTKGDNNAEKDIWTIKPDQVVGKETFQLSDLGVVVTIPQSILGSIFFLIIPCTIIIFSTIQEYWKRIVHFLDRFKKEP